jgi:hypothetical protein
LDNRPISLLTSKTAVERVGQINPLKSLDWVTPPGPTTHSDVRRDFPASGNWRHLARIFRAGLFSEMTYSVLRRSFGPFVSAGKIPFPGNRDLGSKRRGSTACLLRGKAEHVVLARPFGRQVGDAGDTHAVGKPTFDGRFDEIRREKRQRDRHVDFASAASLAAGTKRGDRRPAFTAFVALAIRTKSYWVQKDASCSPAPIQAVGWFIV